MSFPNTNLAMLLSKIHLTEDDIKPLLNKNWILAFSAGADSMLCLHLLLDIHKQFPRNRNLILYFLDHGEQEKEIQSNRDNLIASVMEDIKSDVPDLNARLIARFRDMKNISAKLHGNFELLSSRIRFKHLQILSKQNPDSLIIAGHNLSDWYETFIMRMNRGAALEKLYPFMVRENQRGLDFFRPLVFTTGAEVREICNALNLPYWNDPSNYNDSNMRSRLRKNYEIINADGLRVTAKNLIFKKIKFMDHQNNVLENLKEIIFPVSENREYRIKHDNFINLCGEEKEIIVSYILKKINFWRFLCGK